MTWFNNLRIGVRLAIGFGALGAALLIVAFVGVSGLNSAGNATKELANKDVKALTEISTITDQLGGNQQKVAQHLYVQDGELKAQDATSKEIDENAKEIDRAVGALRAEITTSDERKALAAFVSAHDGYMANLDKAIATSRRETVNQVDERDASRSLYTDKLLDEGEKAEDALDALTKSVDEQAKESASATVSQASNSRTTVIVVALLAAIAAAGLAFLITARIKKVVAEVLDRIQSLEEH